MPQSRQNRNVRLGPTEAVVEKVANARFEGNWSLAIRHIIREWAALEKMANDWDTHPVLREEVGVVRE